MASKMMKVLKDTVKHNVGTLNDWKVDGKLFAGGAKAIADMDNYTLVEVEYVDGVPTMKALTGTDKEGFLLCAVEQVLESMGEQLSDFFVGEGEYGRIIYQPKGTRFQASNFELSGVTEVEAGHLAYYDATTKKFVIFDGAGTVPAAYATAANKYVVHSAEDELEYVINDMPLVQLIAQ